MRSLVTVAEWATPRRIRRSLAALLFAAGALAGCGDNLSPGTDAAVIDAAVIDAAIDAAVIDARPIDAHVDAPTDAAIDAIPIDAIPTDAMTDAPTDAAIDGSTVDQIAAARATADGAGLTLPLDGVYVTYLKPALGTDPAGFTVQASGTGPALFIAVDPATLNPVPAKGDEVRLTITTMGTLNGLRQATAIANYSRIAVGFNVAALSQNITNAADVVSAVGNYESELVDATGTLMGAVASGGSMFDKIQLSTVGVPADVNQRLRLPTTLRDALDLVAGCGVVVNHTPLGRFNNLEAQFTAFTAGDLTVSNCPAPTVVSAVASSSTTVVITFSRRVLAGSVNANGNQFMFDNGLTPSAAVVSGRTVTVTTSPQSVVATYTVSVLNTVTDLQGTALGNPTTAMFPGFVVPAIVRINEFNANITGGCDLIELRVVTGGSLLNLKLTERTGAAGELALTFPAVIVPANAFVVVHLASAVAACNPGAATAETTGPMQQPAATFGGNYDTAYDFWNVDTGLTNTDNVLTLFGPTGTIMDAVLTANLVSGTAAAASETAAATAATANQWQIVGGGVPAGGFIDDAFRVNAVLDLDGTGTAASGTSIQRLDNTDDNDLLDWNTLVAPIVQAQAQTFGALNVGQTAF